MADPVSLRRDAVRAHPDFPWLDRNDPKGVRDALETRGWLAPNEEIRSCEPAGDGNMNLTLRIRTDLRSFVLKQARPWVEKYDHIEAPWERTLFELRFYARASSIPEVAARMPALLASDADARLLLLEDLPGARDLSSLYAGDALHSGEIEALAGYLAALHTATRGAPDPHFANREMRRLNHEHIYEIPVSGRSGLDLDAIEGGLAEAAACWRSDSKTLDALRETGERYLSDGPCLVHGDYFPGSWLRSDRGLRVIDPEFCFFGDPELDLGVAVGHLALAGQDRAPVGKLLSRYEERAGACDREWLARYAAAEVMRRLIGVAQLPLPPAPPGSRPRAALLDRARRALLDRSIAALWGDA